MTLLKEYLMGLDAMKAVAAVEGILEGNER